MSKPTADFYDNWRIKEGITVEGYRLNRSQMIKLLEEHANSKAEEMAIGFGKWLTNSGNIKSHLIENSFEEYKQSLKQDQL